MSPHNWIAGISFILMTIFMCTGLFIGLTVDAIGVIGIIYIFALLIYCFVAMVMDEL